MNLYPWLVLVHIAGAFLFVMAHGASAVIAFRIRSERDPARLTALLETSSMSIGVMYVGLLALLVGGIWAAIAGDWFGHGWPWAAIAVLVLVAVAMYGLASRYYANVRQALGLPSMNDRKGQAPAAPKSPDEIARMLDTRRPEAIAAVGGIGLLVLLWLMVLKPF